MYLILLALIKDEEPKFKIKALIKLLRILKEKYFSSRLATRKKKGEKEFLHEINGADMPP